MKAMNRSFSVFIFLLILFSNSLHAADPITVVQYPLPTRPAIVQAGDEFQIVCESASTTSGWQAKILTPYNEVPLPVTPAYHSEDQQWILTATIPQDTPFELYHLEVIASGLQDRVTHAVKVIQSYKDEYYIVHLPDLHMPSVTWIGYYDDNNSIPEFVKISQELEIINPEFVLQTGDVVDNGREEEQYQIAQDLLFQMQNPIFVTGGNHDLWYDGHDNWHKYFNLVMDYHFNYGNHHYAGLEMYDIPTVTFTADQMEWLQNDLQSSIDQDDPLRALFYHYDESRQIDADFVDNYQIDLILYGHTHINGKSYLGTRNALNLNTSFTMNNNGEYRLIKIANDQITEHPVLKFKNLDVEYTPANDGSNWRVKAVIQNDNPISFEHGLIKLFVRKDAAGYQVSGGTVEQVISTQDKEIYYVRANIGAASQQEILIESANPPTNHPPEISQYTPVADTSIFAGIPFDFSVQASDEDSDPLQYKWYRNYEPISNATQAEFSYTPDIDFTGLITLKVRVSDGEFYDEHSWLIEVKPFTNKPTLITSTVNFFSHNEPMTLQWVEPTSISAQLEYGLTPGNYIGSIQETGEHEVTFTPELIGMGLGQYYCRITDGDISSDPFTIVIESPNAPKMLSPIGNIQELSPTFSWEKVPGVPYYMVICSDQEIQIIEDPETGEMTVEGANPIWSVLTSENNVPYGTVDPSGTFTSVPAPLSAGNSYWWIVLNCYGNAPELTSPVQSGISKFTIDLPPPNLQPPVLTYPADAETLRSETIPFQWKAVENAAAYHFYPFKIEEESGIETARAIWENIIATTETEYEYRASDLLTEGRYRWKVAALTENGMEVQSDPRDFYYQSPSATVTIRTYDSKNTPADNSDDVKLPRVSITYAPIDGIYTGLPLSTDLHGLRENATVSPGTYRFEVDKDGYDTIIDTVRFEEGKQYNLTFRLNPSKSTIIGSVVDNLGDNVGDATIQAQHSLHSDVTKSTSSDAMGHFTLSVIPGPYQISAQKEGYKASSPVSVSVESGMTKTMDNSIVLVKNTNFISGTVLNSSQQPMMGATVLIFNDSEQFKKITDADGHFEFVVANGRWTLHAQKEGFVSPADRTISVSGGSNVTISPSFTLTPHAAIVQGEVSDAFRQLENVTVKAYPSAGTPYQTQSDAYGQFSLNVVPGTYTISAEKDGYSFDQSIQLTLQAGQTQSGLEITLNPIESTIKGKVTTDGYTPLSGVEISNTNINTITSDGGAYELGVGYGDHVLRASKEGYTSSPPETVSVAPGQVVDQVNFILTPNASVIKGRITAAGGGIRHARIQAENASQVTTKSDGNGYYTLNLESGAWHITVSKEGFLPAEKDSVLVGVGQTVTGIHFRLTRNIATVNGTIKDASSGSPIRNATIEIQDKNLTTNSTGDGSFSLEVEPNPYQLTIHKSGFKTVTVKTGSLAVNQTKTLNISLETLSSQFLGKVFDQDSDPLGDVLMSAISATDTFQTQTAPDGSYRLDVQAGEYQISGNKTGYKTNGFSESKRINPGEQITLPDLFLTRDLGSIAGDVIRTDTQQPIPSVRVQVKQSGNFSAQTQTNNEGGFQFTDKNGNPILLPGSYSVIASKSGFQSDTLSNIQVSGSQTTSVQLALAKNLGKITGDVLVNEEAVYGATITAQSVTTDQTYTAISRESGYFEITGIPPGEYEIRVARTGFTSPNPQMVSTGTHIKLQLTKNDGWILGFVTDTETVKPIRGVYIDADDQHGNNGNDRTNAEGYYEITELPRIHPYNVQARKSGYSSSEQESVELSDSTHLNFQLERIYGSVSGMVEDENQNPMADVVITLNSNQTSQTDTTTGNGEFQFAHIPSNRYTLTAQKTGYMSDPIQQIVNLWQGGDVTNILFTMQEAKAATIKIIGPDNISNATIQQYNFTAKTEDQREASIQPVWEVNFASGIDSITQDGLLDPRNDYIGSLQLKITDQHSGTSGVKDISIHQVLASGHPGLQISDQLGTQLSLQDSSVVQNIVIQLRKPKFARGRRNTRAFQIVGGIYQFTPENFNLLKPAELLLPIPSEKEDEDLLIGKWNREWLEWQTLQGQPTGNNQLRIEIDQLGGYAILDKAQPLGVKNLKILPNPFSPDTGPVNISFSVSSNQTTNPQVTLKIYNMIGDLVKTLRTFEPMHRGENTIEWDGITDFGRMAKNGRYVLRLQVRDITGTKEQLKTFVLIK